MNYRFSLPNLARTPILPLVAATLWIHSGSLAESAPTMQSGHSRLLHQNRHGAQGTMTRQRYRPSIRIVSFKQNGKTGEIICDIRVRSGNLDRIEVRSGQKLLGTMKIDRLINYGTFKLKPDLSKAGSGKKSIRVWAWQGRQGYQSVHGESLPIKITNP